MSRGENRGLVKKKKKKIRDWKGCLIANLGLLDAGCLIANLGLLEAGFLIANLLPGNKVVAVVLRARTALNPL